MRGKCAMFGAFPMYVGMNRCEAGVIMMDPGVPHVRGDEPIATSTSGRLWRRSPCTWG